MRAGGGLGKRLAVLTIASKHTSELLAATPFEAEGPAGDMQHPLAAVAYLDWASMVEAARPWIDMGVTESYAARNSAFGGCRVPAPLMRPLQATLSEMHSFLDVLQVLRTYSSASYVEGKALVTHSATHYRDLP